ncbi:MAG: hypothetical protein WA705_14355 [Candidatus Ozemobacteraceae bacterium]
MDKRWFLVFLLSYALLLPVGSVTAEPRSSSRKAVTKAVPAEGDSAKKVRKTRDTKRKFAFGEKNGIKYEIFKIFFGIPEAMKEFNFTYSIEFPSLTQNQYTTLMEHFGGQNLVPYAPDRSYTLADFLHPKIQAFVNRTMDQNYCEFTLPEGWRNPTRPEMEYETGMACWDAAYEVIREFRTPFREGVTEGRFFHIGAPIVDAILKNPAYFDAGTKQSLSFDAIRGVEAGLAERNRGRQIGDILLIDTMANGGAGAAHTMVWLDDELYFEKPDMGTTDPFRIVFYQDGVKFWLTSIVLNKENRDRLAGTFYRYVKNLPDPVTLTDKWYYYDWESKSYSEEMKPKGELPAAMKQKYIWNLDVGLGGGLSKFRVNPVLRFKMGKDACGRAEFIGTAKDFLHKLY